MQNNLPNQLNNSNPNNSQNIESVVVDKKQLKLKIQSRNDFIMIFGFECYFISTISSASKTLYHLAIHF